MAKPQKSLKGNISEMSKSFLRFVNIVIVLGAISTIALQFVIRSSPTLTGWAFILLGILVIISGLFGTISSGQAGCFNCHMFCLAVSSAGLCASFLCTFLLFNNTVDAVDPTMSTEAVGEQYVRIVGALYFVLFAAQMVVLLLATMIHVCGFIDYNEDLEAVATAKLVAKMQREEEAERRANAEAASAAASSKHQLSDKIKGKYKQWTHGEAAPAMSDYDMEASQMSGSRGYHA
ncbi:unnamed protein product [Closterium sp. Yama58-4]|nr:unnamed protein product [Closterium sp. Yama58-4]